MFRRTRGQRIRDDDNYDDMMRDERPRRKTVPSRAFFWAVMVLALLLSAGSLVRRLSVEWNNRSVSIVVDYRDIVSLADQTGVSTVEIYSAMRRRGALGITAGEFIGRDLASGVIPLAFTPLGACEPKDRAAIDAPMNSAVITIDSSDPLLPPLMDYLRMRMPGVRKHVVGKNTLIILPVAFAELMDSGLMPDIEALNFAREVGAAVVYRPVPSVIADGVKIAETLRWITAYCPMTVSVLPAGAAVAGHPDTDSVAEAMTALGLTAAQAEFARQIGSTQLMASMEPAIIPLHSITRDEVFSRRLTREQIVERMIRAVHERSIRLLLMRPYDLYTSGRYAPFLEDLAAIHDSLRARGYSWSWPKHITKFRSSLAASLAAALVFVICLGSYARRLAKSSKDDVSKTVIAVIAISTIVIGLLIWKVSIAARLLGGVTAALIATEAALWALDRAHRPFDGLLSGLMITLMGGAVIASFYGTSGAMLRLTPFSGVRLTLLLPPILVFANDIRLRVHPESLKEIVTRPPLWGELAILGALGIGAAIVAIRSGNSGYIPNWEIAFREMMERLLWVRPRTKEFMIGYPCLLICYWLTRGDMMPRYREIFRLGASVAFASAINTFCHFHTLLPLTVIRVVNGWWLGIVIGFALLFVLDHVVKALASARAEESEV